MSAHTCRTLTRGCFRCELNIDEMRDWKQRDYKHTSRIWAKCEGCGCKWQWNGKTEDAAEGLRTIRSSSCYCTQAWGKR